MYFGFTVFCDLIQNPLGILQLVWKIFQSLTPIYYSCIAFCVVIIMIIKHNICNNYLHLVIIVLKANRLSNTNTNLHRKQLLFNRWKGDTQTHRSMVNYNWTNFEFCKTPMVSKNEFCFHEPPLEMALKIIGKYSYAV